MKKRKASPENREVLHLMKCIVVKNEEIEALKKVAQERQNQLDSQKTLDGRLREKLVNLLCEITGHHFRGGECYSQYKCVVCGKTY